MAKKKKDFSMGEVSFPVNTRETDFVPDAKSFIQSSLDKEVLEEMLASVKEKFPVLLIGPTGSGKTSTISWLANQTNNSYRRIQLNGATTVDNFVGKYLIKDDATYWVDGILTDAMKKGHWLLLDEINAALPEILFVLNSILDDDSVLILDDKEGEVIAPHPDFRLFAAMNPPEDYAGTKELNRAQLDRFVPIIYNYPTKINEEKIIATHSGIDRKVGADPSRGRKGLLSRMVEYAHIIRKSNSDKEMTAICSTRQLIQWGRLLKSIGIKRAAKLAVINKADQDEMVKLTDELDKLFRDGESLAKYEKEKVEIEEKALAKEKAEKERKAKEKKKKELKAELEKKKAEAMKKLEDEFKAKSKGLGVTEEVVAESSTEGKEVKEVILPL